MDVVSLGDGATQVPNDNSLLAVDRSMADAAALLIAAGLPGDTLDLSARPLLLQNGSRNILIDARARSAIGPGFAELPASMADVLPVFSSGLSESFPAL